MEYKYINYQSKDNKPSDIDEYYAQRLKHTNYSNLKIEKLPSIDESTSINDIFFEADDGAHIHAKYVYPTNREINDVLLMFHGYHVDSGSWFDKIAYANLGYAVIALDCRGQSGQSSDNTSTAGSTLKGLVIKGVNEGIDNLHMIRQYLDTYRLGLVAKDLHPNCDLHCIGESQGGALALVASSLIPDVKTCVSQYPYLCDIKHAYELGFGYSGIDDYFKWEDPLSDTYEPFFNKLAYIDVKNLVHKICAKTYLIVGNKDQVCPPICQFAMYNNLQTAKDYYIYHQYGHEHLYNSEDLKMKLLLQNKKS